MVEPAVRTALGFCKRQPQRQASRPCTPTGALESERSRSGLGSGADASAGFCSELSDGLPLVAGVGVWPGGPLRVLSRLRSREAAGGWPCDEEMSRVAAGSGLDGGGLLFLPNKKDMAAAAAAAAGGATGAGLAGGACHVRIRPAVCTTKGEQWSGRGWRRTGACRQAVY